MFLSSIRRLCATALFTLNLPGQAPPNFILVLTDDQGWSSLSAPMDLNRPQAKSDYHLTPNMDALLDRGMRFSDGYAASPVCSPTRYSVQFGKSPARLGYTRVLGENRADHNQLAIPQVLKAVHPNYRCAHLGKWHINASPDRYRYDLHDGRTTNKQGGFSQLDHHREWGGYPQADPKRVDSLTARAVDFIRDSLRQERPFFIQISHYALHSDLVYSEATHAATRERAKGTLHQNPAYAAMIADLDRSIGALLRAYDAMGLSQNTYLIFTSDNGGMPCLPIQANKGKPYQPGLNAPLLRGKWDLTEGGIRVPFAVMGPGIQAGTQSATPVISYDLLPTIAELAGASTALPKNLDGRSFASVLQNPKTTIQRPPEGLVFHFPHYNVVGLNEPHSAIRVGDHKLLKFYSSKRALLFNLAQDPGERINLAKKNPKLASALNSALEQYLDAVAAEKPRESNSWEKGGRGATTTLFLSRYQN